ncbi:hypothetical protein ACL02S_08605 [Nocardia sp. 004]|uniref:hypothetical protein n=1 Tax=Nocardia sp. 004 TaxID=3385978 RepID=UPI0039A028C9
MAGCPVQVSVGGGVFARRAACRAATSPGLGTGPLRAGISLSVNRAEVCERVLSRAGPVGPHAPVLRVVRIGVFLEGAQRVVGASIDLVARNSVSVWLVRCHPWQAVH